MYEYFYNYHHSTLGQGLFNGNNNNAAITPATYDPIAWYAAYNPSGNNTLPSNNTPLTSWSDLTNNSHTATNNTTPPTFLTNQSPNGKPAVNFDGLTTFLTCANTNNATFDLGSGFSALVVAQPAVVNVIQRLFARANSATPTAGFGFGEDSATAYRFTTYFVRDYSSVEGIFAANTPIICFVTFNPSGNTVTFYKNGLSVGSVSNGSGPIAATTPMIIGSANTMEFWKGLIFEVVFYNKVLSNLQQTELYRYAHRVWGI